MAQQDGTRNANVVLKSDNSAYNHAMDESAKSTNSVLASVTALTTGINHMNSQAGRGLQIVGGATLTGLTAATVSAGKLESQLTSLHSSAVMSGRSLTTMDRQVNGLRGSLAITTDQTIALVTQLNKMGQGGAGVTKIATEFVKLSAVTGESIGGLVDGMVSLQRQMGTEGPEYTKKFSSSLATLSARAGVSAQSVLQFSNAIAPIGKVAGMTQTEIMGVSTAFAKSGEDGSRAANAFNTMLTDITRSVQYGSPHLQEYSNLLGVSVDQFKKMNKTEAVTEIFERISKQGPQAIKTLERFGLEGTRTYRSLQAVASTGGLRSALSDASEGYQNNDKYNEASKQALAGLNDEMTKLGNNSTRIVQAFGQGLLPVFTELARAINSIISPFATLLESMGKVPGLAVAAGAGALVLGGSILKSAAGLGTVGLAASAARGTTAAGFRESSGFGNNWSGAAAGRRAAGTGSYTQRKTYDIGAALGRPLGFIRQRDDDLKVMTGMGVRERASRTVGAAVAGAGKFVKEGYSPLFYKNLQDPFHRNPMFGAKRGPLETFRDSRAGEGLLKSAEKPNVLGSTTIGSASAGLAGFSKETKAAAAGIASHNTALKALAVETGRVNLAMARASVGITASAGKMALSGLGKVGRGALGLLGGVPGAVMMGGMGALSLYQHQKGVREGNLTTDVDSSPDKAAGAAYRTALGQAAEATTTFAAIVQQNSDSIANPGDKGDYTGKITASMASSAERLDVNYTDPRIGKMNEEQASVYAQTSAVNGDKKQQQLLALDLTKRFGPAIAQQIMNQATDKDPTIDLGGLASGMGGRSGFFGNASQGAKDSASLFAATSKQSAASIRDTYGAETGAQFLNQATGQIIENGNQNSALSANALAQLLNVSDDDKKSRGEIEDFLKSGFTNSFGPGNGARGYNQRGPGAMQFDPSKSNEKLDEIDSQWSRDLKKARGMSGDSFDPFAKFWKPGASATEAVQNPNFSEAEMNVPLRNTQVARMFLPSSGKADQAVASTRDSWMTEAQATRPMPQYFDKHLSKTMETAISNEGDPNAQARAVNELTDRVMALNPNMSQAVLELAKFKGAAGATTSQISQLGQAAMARAQQFQEEKNFYGTSADQAAGHTENYKALKKYADANPNAPQAEQDAEAARQVTVADKQAVYNRAKSIVLGKRELDIGQGQQKSDFALSRKQATTAFNLQDTRAQENFALQRQRSDESLARQNTRTMRDFNLGRSRSLTDYNLQRSRSDENVALQEKRGLRDYSTGRSRSLYDFNLQRKRGDENVALQEKRGLRDYNTGRDRSLYEFNLSRARSNENVAIQEKRGLRDFNLGRDRSLYEFNLQRKRSDESVAIQEGRGLRDYNLSRTRSLYEFNLQRSRSNESVALQEKRGLRDFTIGRDRSLYEFNLQRKRSDESFSIQQSRGLRDYNLSRTRSMFEFNLQRERGNENVAIQESRALRDFTLSRDRAAYEFNLSRTRQEESYQRQQSRAFRDFNISRTRAQDDFNLQRVRQDEQYGLQLSRQIADYNLQRKRSQDDFNLSRRRQEEDFQHQVILMTEQAARQIYNIYERINVKRTWSAGNLLSNAADQQQRVVDQTQQLGQLREAGVSGDVIKMLGLNESQNAQQLARFLDDVMADPAIVKQFNKMAVDRTGAVGKIVTDEDNSAWQEMTRSFKLNQERASDDFAKGMARQSEDFSKGLARMREDYNRSLNQANADFQRSRDRQKDDFVRGLKDQRSEYNIQVRNAAEDFSRQRAQQVQDFNKSMTDMRSDYARQVKQANTDFARQRAQQSQDFHRSMTDMRSDYARQVGQANTDFARQRAQQVQDFNKSITDSRQDYARQVKQANTDFARQRSQQSQDFHKSLTDMRSDYSRQVGQANTDFARQRAQQTHDFNKSITDTRIDYARQVRQANIDFGRQRSQQSKDFHKSLSDMRDDYGRQVTQANTDFRLQRKHQSQDFHQSITDMRADYAKQVKQSNTDFAKQRAQQLKDLHTQMGDQRSEYKITMKQSATDFAKSRKQQATDFALAMSQQVAAFARQQSRAIASFNRSQEELSGSLNSLGIKGSKSLTGNSKRQFDALLKSVGVDGAKLKRSFKSIGDGIATMFKDWGIPYRDGDLGRAQANAKHADIAARAEGGTIPGHSPHPKADNVLIRATAGEFMQPVDSVKHYGLKTMEAIRTKKISKEALDSVQGLASGGEVASRASLVSFGKRLVKMGYQVGENPSFGGVTPGAHANRPDFVSWHYRNGAIDVNHGAGQSAQEMASLDNIMPLAKALGLGIHWRTKNHFDHAHFDIGGYSAYGSNTLVPNSKIGSLGGSGGGPGADGVGDILKQLKALKGTKDWEALRASRKYLSGIPKDYVAKSLAEVIFSNMGGAGVGSGDIPGPQSTPSGSAQTYAKGQLGKYGWGASQFAPLQSLWNRESSWKWNARNASSGAYGIPQSLPGNKMASAGSDWRTNPATQIDWGLEYIKGRYGAPAGAWAHSQRTNWYGDGAVFNSPRQIGVGDRGPEAVLPLNQKGAAFMHALLSRYNDSSVSKANLHSIPSASKNVTYYSRVDNSTTYTGSISVASNDPNEFLRKMEAQKRMKALIGRKS